MEAKHDVVVITIDDNHVDMGTTSMNVNELINYRHKIIKDLEQVERDLRNLHEEENRSQAIIYDIEKKVGHIRAERNKYAEETMLIQRQINDNTSTIMRDKQDLEYELKRHRG